jgi:hypothetical protein
MVYVSITKEQKTRWVKIVIPRHGIVEVLKLFQLEGLEQEPKGRNGVRLRIEDAHLDEPTVIIHYQPEAGKFVQTKVV